MRFDIITIFPDFFQTVFDFGIVRRARAAGLVEVAAHDLRAWTTDKHRMVDDRPFGGGDGMVLKPEPLFAAVEALTGEVATDDAVAGESFRRRLSETRKRVVLLSPQGRVLEQSLAQELASEAEQVVVICGRYEGVDERVAEALVTDEVSIGDYVLSGGEPAAVVLVDALVRLVPGALGSETSAQNDSFSEGLLDWPHYTRPPEFRGMRVPEVLLGGNHAEIAGWRRRAALRKTRRQRPDLYARAELDARERNEIEERED
ncbi:MAG TPA: tRNA (guanosine(37)-N1)-methyltransferase TrmD [Pyrinomonadaceae bacterium]|jgi:tRNA (guanine37-N1)-methyltransferase|nr:tRNA (guanosine(37)-N1)-methyltransferase TrmD [Pyrinomonadaceae bacterium]